MPTGTAARALSIPELLQVLSEKLDEECSRVREISRFYEPSGKSVENEIESLETKARDILKFLPRLRNQSRPVNRLPTDIISHIAQWVLRIEGGVHVGPIIPLTHVCRYWRDSIISAPENWTRISNRKKGQAAVSLERAGAAPLDVHVTLSSKMEFLGLLRPHAHRVVSLGCHDLTAIWELTQAFPNFPKSMINLQSMYVSGEGRGQSLPIDPFDFSTNTALRKLTWSGVALFPSVLGLRTLTEFNLNHSRFNLHLDTLLSFLGKNRSLERASLDIKFENASLYPSRRRRPVKTSLRELTIWCGVEPGEVKLLVSSIALQKGGTLKIRDRGLGGLNRIISGLSVARIPGLSSPTFMEYQFSPRGIQLVGPSGSFSYLAPHDFPVLRFGAEFPLLPSTSIREVRFKCYGSWVPPQFQLSSFPSLEILAVDGHAMGGSDDDSLSEHNSLFGGSIPLSLSPVLPDPETSPSLKTLAFLDCALTEDFMTKLTRTAFERKVHASPSLQRVVIMNSKGKFPSANSIRWLKEYVAVVEILEGKEIPRDLS